MFQTEPKPAQTAPSQSARNPAPLAKDPIELSSSDSFVHRHIGPRPGEIRAMLDLLELSDLDS